MKSNYENKKNIDKKINKMLFIGKIPKTNLK